MRIILIVIFSLGFSLSSFPRDINKAKLDSLFDLMEKNNKCMGTFSIFQDGKEIYSYSMGFSDFEKKIRANANTVYRIGSVSKMYTAAIILKMIEEAKLELATPLGKFFPEIPDAGKITVEHLLSHRSGLFNFTDDPAYLTWMEQPKSRKEMIGLFAGQPKVFDPGEKMQYSNTNFILLSYIAEKIDGKDFPVILEERIIKPLELQKTRMGGKIETSLNEAKSYEFKDDWKPATKTDMSIPTGAGAVISTPSEMNTFINELFNGKIISKETLELMVKQKDHYGLGTMAFPFYEKTAYGHGGNIDGFQAVLGYFPEENVAVAMTTNGLQIGLNDILIGLLSIYFDKDYQLPVYTPKIEVKPEDLDKYTGVYASPALPMKLTISRRGNSLVGQGTGQPEFPLEAFDKDKFRYEQAGLVIEFAPSDNKMVLLQGGGRFELTRE